MKPLYTEEEFSQAKNRDKLPLECKQCKKTFYSPKKYIKYYLNKNKKDTGDFCSQSCNGVFRTKSSSKKVKCKNCKTVIIKKLCERKQSKSGNFFCSKSCAGTYNNKHKTHGTRRSKLEIWLEEQLIELYPDLDIHFNRKDTIGSELDIYFPSLKFAVELNGIFHYEPIYGQDKLDKIKTNDNNKFQMCQEEGISLCSIDTSSQKYFKPKSSERYLKIITDILGDNYF